MEFISLKCPNCGGSLEIEDGIDTFFCKYCGQKLVLEGQSKETISAKVKVKEFQHHENLQKTQLQHRENLQKSKDDLAKYRIDAKSAEDKRSYIMVACIFIGMLVLLLIISLSSLIPSSSERKHNAREKELKEIEDQVIEYIDEGDYDLALVYANKLIMDDGYSRNSTNSWNKKREEYISIINTKLNESAESADLEIPFSSKYAKDKNYEEIVKMLKDAGFTNISLSTLEDEAFIFRKTDKVDKITIDGKSSFDEGTVFKSNVKIIVYYYE